MTFYWVGYIANYLIALSSFIYMVKTAPENIALGIVTLISLILTRYFRKTLELAETKKF